MASNGASQLEQHLALGHQIAILEQARPEEACHDRRSTRLHTADEFGGGCDVAHFGGGDQDGGWRRLCHRRNDVQGCEEEPGWQDSCTDMHFVSDTLLPPWQPLAAEDCHKDCPLRYGAEWVGGGGSASGLTVAVMCGLLYGVVAEWDCIVRIWCRARSPVGGAAMTVTSGICSDRQGCAEGHDSLASGVQCVDEEGQAISMR